MKKKMKKIFIYALAACCSFASCDDYLETSSPANMDDAFATSSPSEALKIMSKAYATYRQGGAMFTLYDWNDPVRSNIEYYCEANSSNNRYGRLRVEEAGINDVQGGFNGSYSVISYASKLADVLSAKPEVVSALEAGNATDYSQTYGEAVTLRALTYFNATLHFGDIPYGYENKATNEYVINSRFAIYDDLIEKLKAVEPVMYKLGEGGIDGERLSRTFVNALIGKIALHAAGYQTIRTDIDGLYGEVTFENKLTDTANKCAYVRRTDYKNYLTIAETYFGKAMGEAAGSCKLITNDERTSINNPFQRHFQYSLDLQVSPETLFEIACPQGNGPDGMAANGEYLYAFGRGSDGGGSNGAPVKVFAAVRMTPAFYFGGFSNDDPRRDVSAVVTGCTGKGNEVLTSFAPGSKGSKGGICLNKWTYCYMSTPFVTKQRCAGVNYPVMRMAEVYLMQAEAKAGLGKDSEALGLVNDIRRRAFGGMSHDLTNLTGDALKEAIVDEARLELFGESRVTWFMIRSGNFSRDAVAAQNEIKEICKDIRDNGGHTFDNGNTFPAYIWTKTVTGPYLGYNCMDENDPVNYPGWRGIYDYSIPGTSKVSENHNVAIKGLFKPMSADEIATAEADGYVKTEYGKVYADNESTYLENMVGGLSSENEVPRYFFPIPFETISQSNGSVTNGYGLPNE